MAAPALTQEPWPSFPTRTPTPSPCRRRRPVVLRPPLLIQAELLLAWPRCPPPLDVPLRQEDASPHHIMIRNPGNPPSSRESRQSTRQAMGSLFLPGLPFSGNPDDPPAHHFQRPAHRHRGSHCQLRPLPGEPWRRRPLHGPWPRQFGQRPRPWYRNHRLPQLCPLWHSFPRLHRSKTGLLRPGVTSPPLLVATTK